MSSQTHRRDFLKTSAAVGAGYWVSGIPARASRLANEELSFGCIGIGGKGEMDTYQVAQAGNVVAICDIDGKRLGQAGIRYPKAKTYTDYRRLLEEMHKQIDAVTVSTPDHHHAVASIRAMKMGKHCFCQKPLTRTIYESRMMRKVAAENRVVTEMGNQGSAHPDLRKIVALTREGALGNVGEVHVWTDRPGNFWQNGLERPSASECPPPPKHIHWDEFIGPRPFRSYHPYYHPHDWRGWWDFGTGAIGDMGCHTMNTPVMALDLFDPITIEAQSAPVNRESYPLWEIITYTFPATDKRSQVKLTWYDGGKMPDASVLPGVKLHNRGLIMFGDKATLYAPGDAPGDDGMPYVFLPEEVGQPEPKNPLPESPGHYKEWIQAVRGGLTPLSHFDYASRLTETVLLGNLAVWAGKKIEWDAQAMKAKGMPELNGLIKPEFLNGYSL